MKKLFTIAIVLISATVAQAQKEVLFKIKYLPAHNYASVMKVNMNMEMNMTGDSSIINQLKKSGQKFPIIMQMQNITNIGAKTGTVANSTFPINITRKIVVSKMKLNGVDQVVPVANTDQDITGKCTVDGKITLDPDAGGDAVKQEMLKIVDMIQNGVKFPEKSMKIGDTFTQDAPMNMPMMGAPSTMAVKAIYKLIAVKDNLAYFDIVYTLDMKLGETIDMKGGGTGTVVYNMTQNFSTSMQENLNMNYSMVLPQMPPSAKMVGKMTVLIDQTTDIAAN